MKKLISMIAVAALLITGCAKELKVTPTENIKVEYGENLDNAKLFNVKESDENVKVDKVEGFDAKKMGEQEITV
ncbi:flagellar biosynthesis protein FlgM, partial [Erysipelotrichaceae bacterium AM17-60]